MREIWVITAGNRMARTMIRATQRRGASADGFLGGEVEEEEERRLVLDGSLAESSSSIFSGDDPTSEYLLQHFQSMPTTDGAMLRTVPHTHTHTHTQRENDSSLNCNLALYRISFPYITILYFIVHYSHYSCLKTLIPYS